MTIHIDGKQVERVELCEDGDLAIHFREVPGERPGILYVGNGNTVILADSRVLRVEQQG